ncbi:MAG: hypothetical protein JSS20_06185 [Proteobacteria bacterium]|nr:hypothetical protein [Pseudomonadota bacterium]
MPSMAHPRMTIASAALRMASVPLLVAVAWLFGVAIAAAQQPAAQPKTPAPWQSEVEQHRRIEPPTTLAPQPKPQTAQQPAAPKPALEPGKGRLTLSASLSDDTDTIDQGLIWRVFSETPNARPPQPKLIATSKDASPTLVLAPGSYVVNAAYGRAHLTRRLTVQPKDAEERFVLNAGGLRVTALLGTAEKVPDIAVSYEIYQGDADQIGGRAKVVGGVKPGTVVRLNAGLYHLVSTLGDANAIVNADVTVEAGKLTDAVVAHHAARVTLKLVARPGGEAEADTQWSVATMQGDLVRESQGALPTHILAAGQYVASAKHAGRLYQRQFTVVSGEPAQVEVVMQ